MDKNIFGDTKDVYKRQASDGGFRFKIGNQLLRPFIQLYALDMECALSYFHFANIRCV